MLQHALGNFSRLIKNISPGKKEKLNFHSFASIFKMYNSSYGGFFGGSLQNLGSLPPYSGIMGNQRVNRNYLMHNESVSVHCPIRKVQCGELRLQDAGALVEISGRIQNQRLGRFLSLRDDTGITQLVMPNDRIDLQRRLRNMPLNSFLILRGLVTARPNKSKNEKMITGDIEVFIENLVSVHPKRKKGDSDSDDEEFKKHKKSVSLNSASLKLTSEELSKCPTPTLIRHFSQRSHTCGELSKRLVGKSITLCGWVSAKRVGRFVMLKDGYGSVQIVPGIQNASLTSKFQNLNIDSILVVNGVVSRRPPGHENTRVENGNIEILVESLTVVNPHDSAAPSGKEGGEGNNDDGEDGSGKNGEIPIEQLNLTEKNESGVPNCNKYTYRTHNCGELNDSNVGQEVRLMGWIEFSRMNKFALLKDGYGKTQIMIPDSRSDLQSLLKNLSLESVISVEGTVCCRPPGQENTKQKTGGIEVRATDLKVLNAAKELPFYIREFNKPNESVRMQYRYLDLRSEIMQRNLRLRSKTIHKMRRFLIEQLDFVEVDTPTLFKKTPGGAQEFVVPTKMENKFYSLVQSPQQFKQLLMIGGIDRYFQIAHCYRDETCENDRQPEFSQLDVEMSFCEREDVMNLIEDLLEYSWPEDVMPLVTPFTKMTYEEAMNSYGTDKPDLRFDWKFENLTEIFVEQKDNCNGKYNVGKFIAEDDFSVFAFVGRQGGVKFSEETKKNILNVVNELNPNTGFLIMAVKSLKKMNEKLGSLFGPIVANEIEKITQYGAEDVLFLALGSKKAVLESLGKIRVYFADYLEETKKESVRKKEFNFVWIVDFPLFELEGDTIRSSHHPFTQPHPEDFHLLESDPLKVKSLHYDLVLNGNEIGGGSIRIKDHDVQKMILEKILKIESESISHLLEGLASGAPPHGGIALGLDRLVANICGAQSIRDVIAFPKGRFGRDPLSGAPAAISEKDKKRYHLNNSSSLSPCHLETDQFGIQQCN